MLVSTLHIQIKKISLLGVVPCTFLLAVGWFALGGHPASSIRLNLPKKTDQVKVDSDRGKFPAMTQPCQLGAAHDYGQPRNDKPLPNGTIHRSMVAGRKC